MKSPLVTDHDHPVIGGLDRAEIVRIQGGERLDLLLAGGDRVFHGTDQGGEQGIAALGPLFAVQHQAEFVAADPGDEVVLPRAAPQPACRRGQRRA